MRWVLAVLIGLLPLSANAGPYSQIVLTGDSLTSGYSSHVLATMASLGMSGTAYSIISSGATTSRYLGLEIDPNAAPPGAHNFAVQAINGPVKTIVQPTTTVSNPNTDAIIALIGTNDAYQSIVNPALRTTFQNNLAQIANTYQAAITPQGRHPEIFIATLPPILDNPANPQFAQANAAIDSFFNPLIVQTASTYGFHLINVNYDLQQVPNWQGFYSDDGVNTGFIHLGFNGGYQWLANEIISSVFNSAGSGEVGIGRPAPPVQLPEPAAASLAAVGGLISIAMVRRSRRRQSRHSRVDNSDFRAIATGTAVATRRM